jgi:hypothetical protein
MGCTSGRGPLSDNEKAVTAGEDLLGWGKFDVAKAIAALDHETHGEVISKSQLKRAAGTIGLIEEMKKSDEIDSKPFKFYHSL